MKVKFESEKEEKKTTPKANKEKFCKIDPNTKNPAFLFPRENR